MNTFQNALDFAKSLDEQDELSHFRDRFLIPKHTDGSEVIYLCGNSLGLQPKNTYEAINKELKDWAEWAVEGHFKGDSPWLNYNDLLNDKMAKVVGANPSEVVVMNTLTVNLHLMMVSFYRPTKERYKIVIESDAFPSDRYAVESQIKHHGYDVNESLILWKPREGETLLRYEDLEHILEEQGDEIALIMIGGVNYYTGQYFDLKRITEMGHAKGCKVGFDCAHGAGNVALNLHDSGCDFAVWCTYKYLNSGPGSLAGAFVNKRHEYDKDLNRFTGWWSHKLDTRFKMRDEFDLMRGAEGWQLSNPPILSLAAIKASLDVFDEAGIDKITKKSKKLTDYFEFLINGLQNKDIQIITPRNSEERGCQLSIRVKNADKSLFNKISERGVICDWREPDVIRCAPVPLYNSFEDVYRMVKILKEELITA